MLKLCVAAVLALVGAAACAHHGAVRVLCDGVLRPINRPDVTPPASVEPAVVVPPDEGHQP